MPKSGEWFKEARSQVIGLIITFALPTLTTVATVGFGIAEKMGGPVTIFFAVIVFFFSTASVFLIQASRWFIDVEHKLRYQNTAVFFDLDDDNRAAQAKLSKPLQQRTIEKMKVGAFVVNAANYPISAFLEMASTNVEGRCPTKQSLGKKVTIGPGNTISMTDELIQMDSIPCGTMKGRVDMRIRYGEVGKEKYVLELKGDLQIFIQPIGILQAVYTNWDTIN